MNDSTIITSRNTQHSSWRWLARPRPLAGESLSSLMARAADINGIDRQRFYQKTIGANVPADLDMPSPFTLATIADRMGLSIGQVSDCTLHANHFDFVQCNQPVMRYRWLLPDWVHPEAAGIPICPACIDETGQPHLQLAWRSAFMVYCLKHRTPLVDRCPACDTSISRSKMDNDAGLPGSRCLRCQHELRIVRTNDVDAPWIEYQEGLNSVELPTCWQAVGATHPFVCLAGVRAFINLLQSSKINPKFRALVTTADFDPPSKTPSGAPRFWSFEYAPATHRVALLDAIANLFRDWPHHFLDLAEQSSLRWSDFQATNAEVPCWLQGVIDDHLRKKRYSFSQKEVLAAAEIAKRNPDSFSRAAVGRILGGRDSTAMDRIYGRLQRRMTPPQITQFFEQAVPGLEQIPNTRTQRECARRTLIMIAICVVTNWKIEDVCRISNADAATLMREYRQQLGALLGTLKIPRPGEQATERYFLSRDGAHLRGATARMIASRLVHEFGPIGCWASVDALRRPEPAQKRVGREGQVN
ncbi:MAG: TniQ family protein [Burkholderiales bacterium]|nr:TniQ family protein [Burkholderiales bacterium]